jgi:hypothetical protein
MPRPRRPFSGLDVVNTSREPYLRDVAASALPKRMETRWVESLRWHYPTPNGQQDPLTYMFVLDLLMNMDPSIELRASEAVKWLSVHRNAFTWDAVTVGKVISDLCDNIEEVAGKGNGLLERGRDWRGVFYVFHRSFRCVPVCWALRDDLQRLAEHEVSERRAGRKTDFMGSPLVECPSVRGAFVSPLREGVGRS